MRAKFQKKKTQHLFQEHPDHFFFVNMWFFYRITWSSGNAHQFLAVGTQFDYWLEQESAFLTFLGPIVLARAAIDVWRFRQIFDNREVKQKYIFEHLIFCSSQPDSVWSWHPVKSSFQTWKTLLGSHYSRFFERPGLNYGHLKNFKCPEILSFSLGPKF